MDKENFNTKLQMPREVSLSHFVEIWNGNDFRMNRTSL